VFVNGKETVDQYLLDMLLDYAENLHELTMLKEKYHSYIKGRNYRKSYERDTLIDLIVLKNITTH
jgi:hypothetical protein